MATKPTSMVSKHSGPVISEATIRQMAKRLSDTFGPLRIVLFGSCARGESKSGSDVDLLVLMPNGTNTRTSAVAMMSELRDVEAAKDIVVATPEMLAKFGDTRGLLYKSALRERKDLYERYRC